MARRCTLCTHRKLDRSNLGLLRDSLSLHVLADLVPADRRSLDLDGPRLTPRLLLIRRVSCPEVFCVLVFRGVVSLR